MNGEKVKFSLDDLIFLSGINGSKMIWNKKTLTSVLSAFCDHSREKLENISKKRLTCARKATLSAIISAYSNFYSYFWHMYYILKGVIVHMLLLNDI